MLHCVCSDDSVLACKYNSDFYIYNVWIILRDLADYICEISIASLLAYLVETAEQDQVHEVEQREAEEEANPATGLGHVAPHRVNQLSSGAHGLGKNDKI